MEYPTPCAQKTTPTFDNDPLASDVAAVTEILFDEE